MDSGSESALASLRESAENENVAVYALTLPEVGKAFVSDTFSLQGLSSRADRGGFKAGVDAAKLVSVLNRSTTAVAAADPFSILTAATGGTQLHFRKQRQLEDAIAAIGVELRSAYLLSYYPNSAETGYHTVKVEVDVPGAKVYVPPRLLAGQGLNPRRPQFFSTGALPSPPSCFAPLRNGFTLPSARVNQLPPLCDFAGAASGDTVVSARALPDSPVCAAASTTGSLLGTGGSGTSTVRTGVALGADIAAAGSSSPPVTRIA